MAETMRSIATIQTLLADNTTATISPTDLRDALIATIRTGYGEIDITSSAATTLSDTSTWVQVAGTYEEVSPILNWDMTQTGRLYYTGAADREVYVSMAVSMTCGSSNQVTEWGIGKEGAIVQPSVVQRKIQTGTDVGNTSVHGLTTISNGEYITAMCRNTTASNDLTATTLDLTVLDFAA